MAIIAFKRAIFVLCVLLWLPLAYTILDDSTLYEVFWPGKDFDFKQQFTNQRYDDEHSVVVQTEKNEKYKCMLPSSMKSQEQEDNFQDFPSPVTLLSPILKKKTCTYRLEAYWTYEICHGKHIRQYHEEKAAGGSVKIQEYFLGRFTEEPDGNGIYTRLGNIPENVKSVPTKKIDGVMMPYYALQLKNGTPCELKGGSKRKAQVLYVCHPDSRNEIMSVTEASSCEYELVVLTPTLCENPFYKVKGSEVNGIYCTPLNDSPTKPIALEEGMKKKSSKSGPAVIESSDMTEIDVENSKDDYRRADDAGISSQTDKALLRDFLTGDFCLRGSSGWWSYEYCYGKHVRQYHDDKVEGRTTVMVGYWDEEAHKEWTKKKSPRIFRETLKADGKRKEKKVIMVEHFYHKGDFCKAIGKPREVVVKLKCKSGASKHAVTIYLREPTTCSYVLGVESPIICDLLDTADENGLFAKVV